MKKIFILACCLLGVATLSHAQDQGTRVENSPLLTKNGYRYLPVKGDYAIGIEATPFFEYLGNAFNNSSDNKAPLFNGVDNTIYGKYFLENNRAVRAKLRINIGSDTYKGIVPDDERRANNPLDVDATATDIMKVKSTDIELRVGYEFRRGHGRVQGFWGGEVGFNFVSGSYKYDYANPMTAANQAPSTWDFADQNPTSVPNGNRATEAKLGKGFGFTAAGFVGIEYFFAPHLSLGGEFNLGFTLATKGQDEVTREFWNAATNKVETQTTRYESWVRPVYDNANNWLYDKNIEANKVQLFTRPSGSIFLLFYF